MKAVKAPVVSMADFVGRRRVYVVALFALMAGLPAGAEEAPAESRPAEVSLFDRSNLVAWCIVPFDSRKRGPEARAEMLSRMGIFQLAYDWRAEHIPTFDEEIETLNRWGIKLRAFWFPAALNDEAQAILSALKRHNVQTELWVSMNGGEIQCTPEEHRARVESHAAALRPIVEAAAGMGCKVGLYNHGGWFGEPENQVEIIQALNAPNVGIVYNLHHGHAHLDRFGAILKLMQPYLLCINLNGMVKNGDQIDKKILPLGTGDEDLRLLRATRDSGYKGPIGILGHTMDDAEDTLLNNLDGLDWLVPQLDGAPPQAPRPPLRAPEKNAASGAAKLLPVWAGGEGLVVEGEPAYRTPPVTVQFRTRLHGRDRSHTLIACETKESGGHWEIYTEAETGHLGVHVPGLEPGRISTSRDICDGNWHEVALEYAPGRVRVFVEGEPVADQPVQSKGLPEMPGGLAFGRLVEGGPSCDGELDRIKIFKSTCGANGTADTSAMLAFWSIEGMPHENVSSRAEPLEDPARRAALPEYQVIPAAAPETLTPAEDVPSEYYTRWARSHGDPHNTRYARFSQITRENVHRLKVAWEYHSGDEPGNVQCNPIVVDGVLYGPTTGEHVAALNAATGDELWRFKPGGKPAFRGLVYWPGNGEHPARILFTAGRHLWALDPKTGHPVPTFGNGGKVVTGESRVAGAVYQNVFVLPTFARDISGYDVRTGERLWTFHTIPQGDEYGSDTWDDPESGANCWGGMALDEKRGIAYVSTGSPKPNFAGNSHRGQNLFANCVVALDALTGKRIWHFQELRHDIWDLDIPAAPNLVTLNFQGRRVDAVAQVTKVGNTLLLDRLTGKPLFPFRMRRAPVSELAGERTWPYQPDLELPEPFARQVFTHDDVTDRTPEASEDILQRISNANCGWYVPFEEDKPTVLYGWHGGAEWTGAAFDPETGRLYVTSNNVPWIVTVFRLDEVTRPSDAPPTRGELLYQEQCAWCHGPDKSGIGMNPPLHGLGRRLDDAKVRDLIINGKNQMPPTPEELSDEDMQAMLDYLFLRDLPPDAKPAPREGAPLRYSYNGYPKLLDLDGFPGCKPPWGTLNCLDLATGKLLWQVPIGTHADAYPDGRGPTGRENFGGATVTSTGLVFCAGTSDNLIRAFDADTGKVLWEHPLPFGGYAPPTVYEVDGRQYVAIPATGGGKLGPPIGDAYVAFALE